MMKAWTSCGSRLLMARPESLQHICGEMLAQFFALLFHMNNFGFTNLLAVNFDILRADFEALDNAKAKDFKDQLVELIKRHQKLLSLAKRTVRLFAFANAAEFCASTLVLGFMSFNIPQLLRLRLYFIVVVFAFQVIASVWRIFLFCNQAQKVIDGSESIADAAYSSGWEKLEEKAPKDMIRLVILRSQRPVKIRAMRFVVISMEAMTVVS